MENIVSELYKNLLGEQSIPQRLRLKKKVPDVEFNKLISMTERVVEYYKNEKYVPKKLAACFIDIYNQFSFKEDFYSTKKLEFFEDIGIKLQELAFELFDE